MDPSELSGRLGVPVAFVPNSAAGWLSLSRSIVLAQDPCEEHEASKNCKPTKLARPMKISSFFTKRIPRISFLEKKASELR